MLVDIGNGLAYGRNLLRLFVGYLSFKLLFKGHDQLDEIKRVGLKILAKSSFRYDLLLVYAEQLYNDLADAGFCIGHQVFSLVSVLKQHGNFRTDSQIVKEVLPYHPSWARVLPLVVTPIDWRSFGRISNLPKAAKPDGYAKQQVEGKGQVYEEETMVNEAVDQHVD